MICLSGASTFFTIDGADQPAFWPQDELRAALAPSGALAPLEAWNCCMRPALGGTACRLGLHTSGAVQGGTMHWLSWRIAADAVCREPSQLLRRVMVISGTVEMIAMIRM